ncbi:MAG: hypothetical protein H8E81_05720 [Deltaproteobacteria bacterium]|nr:hypothetical protein [Deltaproteobacteria bacterium]
MLSKKLNNISTLCSPLFVLFTFSIFIILSPANSEAASWTGTWETKWQGGGAKMHLVQSGNRVTGTYEYKNGRIDGTIDGNRLNGTWVQDGDRGTIRFEISPDGQSFKGTYNGNNWWNGKRAR